MIRILLVALLGFNFSAMADTLKQGQITQIMKTANEGEVDAAKLAKSRAMSADVKSFADMMIKDHNDNEAEVKKVAKKEKLGMEKSDAEAQLKTDTKNKIADLKTKKGADFDKAYIASQVDMHTQLLNNIKTQFLPNAENQGLKDYLQKTSEHVEAHLQQAQKIQAQL